MQYFILSNNSTLPPMVAEDMPVRRVEGGIDDFYTALGALLQNSCELISAPLPPNVPLIRSPVRSVIMRMSRRKYDTEGLLLLEKAKERSASLGTTPSDRLLRDLEMIDRDHVSRAIRQLREMVKFEDVAQPA